MAAPNRNASVIDRAKQIEDGTAVITRFYSQLDDEVKSHRHRTEANYRLASEILLKVKERYGEPRARELVRRHGQTEWLVHVKAAMLPDLIRAADESLV